MGFAPATPGYQGTPSAWGRSAHRNDRLGRLFSSPCGDRSIKRGLFLSYPQKKKENPGTGGLCRSLPPANAPGLNPYIVEFGHSTTHRGDGRILGPPTSFRSPRKFFCSSNRQFFGVKGCCNEAICTFCSSFRPRPPGVWPQITFFSVTVKGRKPLIYKEYSIFKSKPNYKNYLLILKR